MKYLIVNHGSDRPGSVERMENFLIDKGETVSKLVHPLEGTHRQYTSFSNRNISKITLRKRANIFSLISDFFRTIKVTNGQELDVYIGATNFDTIPAVFCKLILRKKIARIIYYPRDFFEERYNNKVLNAIYYNVEKIAVRYSDITISNTERAASKRKHFGLIDSKSRVVPNGVKLDNPSFLSKRINKQKFIYVGDVSVEHGLYDSLTILGDTVRSLKIIGGGSDLKRVLKKCEELKIKVILHKDKSHEFVIEQLQRFRGYGLAYYNTQFKWTIYCSPLKVAEYISTGVPVVMSDVPEVAGLVKDKKLGVVLRSSEPSLAKKQLAEFDSTGYSKKSEWFYGKYNSLNLYESIFYETYES